MSEKLGNFKSTPVIFNGEEIGSDCESDEFRVGKHCIGTTVDGKNVCSFKLLKTEVETKATPEVDITPINKKDLINGDYFMEIGGISNLNDWEKLTEDLLNHIRQLKKGEGL